MAPTTTTTIPPTTTSTTVPKPVDPLAGATLLATKDRKILALDANGNVRQTLVTVFEGRLVNHVQLLGDHRTIWYSTMPDWHEMPEPGADHCNTVVRLDLVTDDRTVIARADDFSVSADGSRVALTNVVPADTCTRSEYAQGVTVVRDLATGAQSTVTNDYPTDLTISPDGSTLVAREYTSITDGDMMICRYPLIANAVPDVLGAPITLAPAGDATRSFLSIDARPDGLYAVVDPSDQMCGGCGMPEAFDASVTIRRLPWNNLSDAGTEVIGISEAMYFPNLVVTDNGMYAVRANGDGGMESEPVPGTLVRLAGDGAEVLQAVFDYSGIAQVPTFAG